MKIISRKTVTGKFALAAALAAAAVTAGVQAQDRGVQSTAQGAISIPDAITIFGKNDPILGRADAPLLAPDAPPDPSRPASPATLPARGEG